MALRSARASAAVLATALVACSTVKVGQDYDPAVDFSAYRTFAWLAVPVERTGNPRVDNPLLHQRIRVAIERTLESRGYRKVSDGAPDFLIGYHVSLETKLDVHTMSARYGYGRYGRWGAAAFPQTEVREYEKGTLVIDVVAAREKRLVWRGSGSRRVQESPRPEEVTRRVNDAVAEILAEFPPNS
jgi:hypothetical protein